MKKNNTHRCNHCGGLMRKYMDGAPTCINCGRDIEHSCTNCCFIDIKSTNIRKLPMEKPQEEEYPLAA